MKPDPARLLILALLGLTAASLWEIRDDVATVGTSVRNLGLIIDRALPPDLSVLDVAVRGIRETFAIAFLGTLFGAALALPLSVLASRNLFPGATGFATRATLAAIRSMPTLMWAIVFVVILGLGPVAGIAATTLYTIGFLGKLQYEAIEGLDREPLEAVRALGATRLQTVRHVVLPEAGNSLVSHILFLLEYNVRHSSVIGLVGAGGIGYYLGGYLRFFQYDRALVLLLVVFLVVIAMDITSGWLRRRFREHPAGTATG